MGNCGNKDEGKKQNDEITNYLNEEKKRMLFEVKLLLLGAGESGKSTIAKQMKIIHLSGFSKEECITYKSIIYSNVLNSMKALITAARKFELSLNNEVADRFLATAESFNGSIFEVAQDVIKLWADPAIQTAYERRSEYQLNDNAKYYFDSIDRITADDYLPSEQDVLQSRAKTSGVIETQFNVEKTVFKLVDVGGQRSERKKWIHCFQDVTAVLFCVALSEYDLTLYEDANVNRMHESVKLFKEICNNRWFGTSTSMILFLNKRDLFADKIQKVDLKIAFPDYAGGCKYDPALNYIKQKFLAQNESKKLIYVHVTCATDTDCIQKVFSSVQDSILQEVIKNGGVF